MTELSLHTSARTSEAAVGASAPEKSGVRAEARRRQAAEEFEAIFVRYMLREMRKAQAKDGLFGSGTAGDFYQSLLETAVAEQIARREQLGLAEMVLRQLEREAAAEDTTPAAPQATTSANTRAAKMADPELRSLVVRAARTYDLDPELVQAVVQHESAGDPGAVSPKGAIGLMQLMPETAREIGVKNPYDPVENVFGGARYLAEMLKRFADNPELALAAYNAGPAKVEQYGGIPPYQETRDYVARVLKTWHSLKQKGI